ncbi:MAG: YhgE/Pip domain-containing protein [Gulosibacter sp.]|uniref:YhgE/Pip domain-containing protein n=1 Tax=Gulosibacter sp. TaxID=2817531 RepID=UPI003F92BC83
MSASTRTRNAATGFAGARARNLLLAVLLPLTLVGMYFAALGGAEARTGTLPALIVNNDQGATQANMDGSETQIVAGRLLVSWLTSTENVDQFDWQLASEETAQSELNAGNAFVSVTIPEDFSESIASLSGGEPHSARIDITTDQSKDWLTGAVSQDVFEGLTAQFGQTITNSIALGLADGLNESAEGLQEAADGAFQLRDGVGELDSGFAQFMDGSEQLADGTASAHDGAVQFSGGVDSLRGGVEEYTDGVGTYIDGVNQYVGGVSEYSTGVTTYVDGVGTFADGVDELADGLDQLDSNSGDLRTAADELDEMAGQLRDYGPEIEQAAGQLEQLAPLISGLEGFDPSALLGYCEQLEAVDPSTAQDCRDSLAALGDAIDTSGIDLGTIETELDAAIDGLGALTGAGDGLSQLADGITAYTDGVSQVNDGAQQLSAGGGELVSGGDQLIDGSEELTTGGEQVIEGGTLLIDGGPQLVDGASQLGDASSELADGLGELSDGQQELLEGGGELGDGIGELEDGAGTMAQGLQDGADQAATAVGDPQTFADVVSEPIVSETTAQNDPTFGGVLGAIGLAVGIWLAAMITAARRRVVADDVLESSAKTSAILLTAARKLTIPVGIVAAALSLAAHIFLGAPWLGFLGTFLIAVVATLAIAAVHLLLASLLSRRTATVFSAALLLVQLLLLRGFTPLEFSAEWVAAVSGFMPLSQIVSALQPIYAGGAAVTVFSGVAGLVLIAVIAVAITAIVLARKRRVDANTLNAQGTKPDQVRV